MHSSFITVSFIFLSGKSHKRRYSRHKRQKTTAFETRSTGLRCQFGSQIGGTLPLRLFMGIGMPSLRRPVTRELGVFVTGSSIGVRRETNVALQSSHVALPSSHVALRRSGANTANCGSLPPATRLTAAPPSSSGKVDTVRLAKASLTSGRMLCTRRCLVYTVPTNRVQVGKPIRVQQLGRH